MIGKGSTDGTVKQKRRSVRRKVEFTSSGRSAADIMEHFLVFRRSDQKQDRVLHSPSFPTHLSIMELGDYFRLSLFSRLLHVVDGRTETTTTDATGMSGSPAQPT